LKFASNDNKIVFWYNCTKILEASVKGGVYIISWVKLDLGHTAFSAINYINANSTIDATINYIDYIESNYNPAELISHKGKYEV
jgi:hypothetical protein